MHEVISTSKHNWHLWKIASDIKKCVKFTLLLRLKMVQALKQILLSWTILFQNRMGIAITSSLMASYLSSFWRSLFLEKSHCKVSIRGNYTSVLAIKQSQGRKYNYNVPYYVIDHWPYYFRKIWFMISLWKETTRLRWI